LPTYDTECEKCKERKVMMVRSEMMSDDWSGDCDCGGKVKRIFVRASFVRVGGEGSDRQIAAMQKSFKERFYKKDADDLRHKHGAVFEDAQRSAALKRIKDGLVKK